METLELPKNQTLKQKQNNILKKRINYFDCQRPWHLINDYWTYAHKK